MACLPTVHGIIVEAQSEFFIYATKRNSDHKEKSLIIVLVMFDLIRLSLALFYDIFFLSLSHITLPSHHSLCMFRATSCVYLSQFSYDPITIIIIFLIIFSSSFRNFS